MKEKVFFLDGGFMIVFAKCFVFLELNIKMLRALFIVINDV